MKININLFNKIKWIVLCVMLGGLFVSFLYDDLVITYTHSMNFLECLFSGNFFGFYDYTLERLFLGYPADYYIIIYAIFGIWNLPVWLLVKFFHIDPYSVVALLWARSILIPFIVGVFFIIHRIFELLGEKDTERTYFLISSSLLFVCPIFVMGQYDIISLFFVLCGILQCMKENKVSWKSCLVFALAIPIKILAVFPVMIIILLQEKRIMSIIRKILLSMSGLFLCIIPYMFNAGFREATKYNGGWFEKLSREIIPSGWNGISIFWFCFFCLCILAYKMKQDHVKVLFKQLVWLLTAFYCLFFVFVEAHPQWSVLLVPFMILLIRSENHDFKLNGFLELIASASLVISQGYFFHWVYFTDTTSWLILKNIENKSNVLWITSLRDIGMVGDLIPLINGLYLAAVIGLLIVNHPWKNSSHAISDEVVAENVALTKVGIDTLRILSILCYIAVTFLIVYVV